MEQFLRVARKIWQRCDSDIARQCIALADSGEWSKLQRLTVNPSNYADPETYWRDALCVDLLRKCDISQLSGENVKRAAVDATLECERACAETNRMVRRLFRDDGKHQLSDVSRVEFLLRWKDRVAKVFGKCPEVLAPAFSSGATTETTRLWSTTLDRLSTTPALYSHSGLSTILWFWTSGWGAIAAQRGCPPRVALGNEYFSVAKNGLTDRPACKEAPIPGALQLGIARVLRARILKILKCDLTNGQAEHQRLAKEASLYGHLATIDMSSASDRWARELVRFLLPSGDWYEWLNSTRATHTLFCDPKTGTFKRLYLEKFSSMGNGYTFELETILFCTLAQQVMEDEGLDPNTVRCYGDDLIVPAAGAIAVLARLNQFGHKPNLKKTFIEGPFRESCGGDFFNGVAVNTVKLEELPKEPHNWMSLANNLRRVAGSSVARWALVKPAWEICVKSIPSQIRRCRGPVSLGDVVLHDRPEEWWTRNEEHQLQVRAWKPVASRRKLSDYIAREPGIQPGFVPRAVVLAATFSQEPISNGISLRQVEGYKLGWVFAIPDPQLPAPRVTRTDTVCLRPSQGGPRYDSTTRVVGRELPR